MRGVRFSLCKKKESYWDTSNFNKVMYLNISITEEHIRKGRPKSNLLSPLALAIKERGFTGVMVMPNRTLIKVHKVTMESKLQGVIKQFNKDYWAGKPLRPTTGVVRFFDLKEIQRDIFIHIESKGGLGEPKYE